MTPDRPGRPAEPFGRQGHQLYRARTAAGLTQPQACKLLRCSLRAWTNWERGHAKLDRLKLKAILAELEQHRIERRG